MEINCFLNINQIKFNNRIYIFLLFGIFATINIKLCENEHYKAGVKGVLHSDAYWYYMYAPEYYFHNNFSSLPNCLSLQNGKTLNKYTIGVSILQFPFFLTSTILDTNETGIRKGYSDVFGYGILAAAIFYSFAGLLMIFRFLSYRYNQKTAWASVLILYFGTNLLHYIYAEPGMSHVYSFFCASGVLYFTFMFYEHNYKLKYFVYLSCFLSLAILIRPTNILFILWPLFYQIKSKKELLIRLKFWVEKVRLIIIFLGILCIIISPQILYWYLTTENFISYTYGYNKEGFSNWANPYLFQIFLGVHNGWLIYSPIMTLFFIGLFSMYINKQDSLIPIIIIFILISYLCASWWAYNFSCAFGYRSFIEFYPIFVIPVSYAIFKFFSLKSKFQKNSIGILIIILVLIGFKLNLNYSAWPFCSDIWSWKLYYSILTNFDI